MYVCQLSFDCIEDIEIATAQGAISALLDAYRYNGQIIGREFPISLSNSIITVTCVCPDKDALAIIYNDEKISEQLKQLAFWGLSTPKIEIVGLESQSDFVDLCNKPEALVLYSTFVQSCSPIRCLTHFSPIPLYRLPENVRYDLIKWQESYGAYDQIQMNGQKMFESAVVEELSNPNSELLSQGRAMATSIHQQSGSRVYIYLYRLGGESLAQEQQRKCPSCGEDWLLSSPLFDLFDFQCHNCLLVSNISWDWQ